MLIVAAMRAPAASAADVPMTSANAPNGNAPRGLIPITISVLILITNPIMFLGALSWRSVIERADATVCDALMTTSSVNETQYRCRNEKIIRENDIKSDDVIKSRPLYAKLPRDATPSDPTTAPIPIAVYSTPSCPGVVPRTATPTSARRTVDAAAKT